MLGEVMIQRKIEEKDVLTDTLQVNTEGLAVGLYSVSIVVENFKATEKFVVVHR